MTINSFLSVNNLLTDTYSNFRTTITNPFLSINILLTDKYIRYSEINNSLNKRKEGEYKQHEEIDKIEQSINDSTEVFNNNPLFLLFTYYCELFNEFNIYEALLKQKNNSNPINKANIDEVNYPLLNCEKNIKNIINEKIITEIVKINTKTKTEQEQLNARKARIASKARMEQALEKQVNDEKLVREFLDEEDNGKSHSFSNEDFQKLQDEDFVNINNDKSIKKHIVSVIGDGDCFINAIFDYLIYNNKLLEMYNRLKKIHKVINKSRGYIYDLNLKNIKESLLKTQDKDIIDTSSSYYDSIKDQIIGLNYNYMKDSDGNIRFTQVVEINTSNSKKNYNKLREDFLKSMKYTLYLYSKTIGKKDNIKMLKEQFVDPSFVIEIGISDYITTIKEKRIKEKIEEKIKEANVEDDNLKNNIKRNFENLALNKILTDDDCEKIHEKYIDYYFNNNQIESERFLIHIYNKICITRINNMPLFVIIITDSKRSYPLYKKKLLQSGKYEETFYIRMLFENINNSGIQNHFNLIISKRNSYFNKILEDKLLEKTQEDDNDELFRQWLQNNPQYGYGGAKRIQAKSLHKSERVTNDPKKPSPKKPSPKKPSPKKPSPKKPSPKKPSPKKPSPKKPSPKNLLLKTFS
jgi:hypothetical protein